MEESSDFRCIHAGSGRKRYAPLSGVPRTPELKKSKLSEITPPKSPLGNKKRKQRASYTVLRKDVGWTSWRDFYYACRESGIQYELILNKTGDKGDDGIKIFVSDLVWLANETTRLFDLLNEDTTEEEGGEIEGDQNHD